jgi:hypothetical protein
MTRSLYRRAPLWLAGGVVLLLLGACQRAKPDAEEAQVAQTFDAVKSALLDRDSEKALAYVPRGVDAYLNTIKAPIAAGATPSPHPTVDLYLRRALVEKVPPDLRAQLTFATLLRRVLDRHLIHPRDLRGLSIGPVTVAVDRASAEVYDDGVITPVRLPFLREDGVWKLDILALLPDIETLLYLDRTLTRQTADVQVDQLVAKLPSL